MQLQKQLITVLCLVSCLCALHVHRGDTHFPRHHHKHRNGANSSVQRISDYNRYDEDLKTRLLEASSSDEDVLTSLSKLPESEDAVTFSTTNLSDKEFFGAMRDYMGTELDFED